MPSSSNLITKELPVDGVEAALGEMGLEGLGAFVFDLDVTSPSSNTSSFAFREVFEANESEEVGVEESDETELGDWEIEYGCSIECEEEDSEVELPCEDGESKRLSKSSASKRPFNEEEEFGGGIGRGDDFLLGVDVVGVESLEGVELWEVGLGIALRPNFSVRACCDDVLVLGVAVNLLKFLLFGFGAGVGPECW